MDQIFTSENKKQAEFLPFLRFTCFLNGLFHGLWVNIFGSPITHTLQKTEEFPLACLYLKFSLGYGYPHLLLYKRL